MTETRTASPRSSAFRLFVLGAALGIAIWGFSPWLTGKAEPWDAEWPIWPLSWLALAIGAGSIGKLRGLALPLGFAVGQMAWMLKSVFGGEFGALGWLFIAGYAAVSSAVALAMIGVGTLLRRWRQP
jgi:hypothetical protein